MFLFQLVKKTKQKNRKGGDGMSKMVTTAITGAVVAMAVGTTAYMMSGNGKSKRLQKKNMKKTATKALQTVGGIIDSVSNMMG